jgi:predicted amidohydrolase YtcJ
LEGENKFTMLLRPSVVALLLVVLLSACHSRQNADLIVYNGVVYTVDSSFSKAEAFAVKDGKLSAVGSDKDILDNYTAPQIVNAGGRSVYPGFIDAHAHFVGYGQSLYAADLFGCTSSGEMVRRVQEFAKVHPGMGWIMGRGWDQNRFPGKAFPDNARLNVLFPTVPVVLERVDGHALLANARALELAGITAGRQLAGGMIETKRGRLTGILVDNAQGLLKAVIPPVTPDEFAVELASAEQRCFAQGLTTITDCGLDRKEIEGIDSLQRVGKLRMRMYVMISDRPDNLDYYIPKGPYKTDRLYVKGVKAYADGALGSRGACLLEPYADRPGWSGFLLSSPAHFDSLAQRLQGTDFQLCTHAIGDSANRVMLTIYNKHLGGMNDKRWRIEHAQIINQNDFELFGKASIVPSVQPTHATSDMYWARDRLGAQRLKGGYAYKQLLQQNGWIALGTDFPVEDISPFKTFLAAVFRVDAKGFPSGGFQPENALSREETIRGMTIWAAKADCLEKEVGSIEAGKKADFVVLDRDLMTVSWDQVLQTRVVSTWVGGVKVYSL